MNKFLEKANLLHKDEKYGDKPFSYHLKMVSDTYERLYGYEDISACVCAFHDVLESGLIECSELADWIMSRKEFEEYEVCLGILPAIFAITKDKNDTRKEYLLKVKKNPLATKVKIADAMCNLRECLKDGNLSRAQYYQNTLDILLGL